MDRSIRRSRSCSRWFVALGFGFAGAMSIAPVQGQEPCGSPPVIYPFPYTDVAGVGAAFCPGIMEAYVTGVSKGTTPTTFSPTETVTRVQMTTFLQRSLDQGLTRASRRTVLKQLWQDNYYPQAILSSGLPVFCAADGDTIWVASQGEVDQIQASSGKVLASWTGPTKSWPIAVIPGAIITADNSAPNGLYFIDPTAPPGPISASYTLPGGASSIAFDGINYWIANFTGSVSILTGLTLQTYSAGFSKPVGLVYDGTQMWVTDYGAGDTVAGCARWHDRHRGNRWRRSRTTRIRRRKHLGAKLFGQLDHRGPGEQRQGGGHDRLGRGRGQQPVGSRASKLRR